MKKLLLIAVLLAPAGAAAQVPTGTVSGEVRTREGQPAVGVRVSAMAVPEAGVPANSGTALVSLGTTDNQGRYRLENVLPGRYYITAGFVDAPTYYPGVAVMSGATVVNVLSGTPVTGINFAVANPVGVSVTGRVRSSTGNQGVGGQPVVLLGGAPPVQQTTTVADGSFQFLRVRPGSYQLLSVVGRTNQPLQVAVGDRDVTGLEIVVIPTVNVTGAVVIEGNAMLPRLRLLFSQVKGTGQNVSISSQPDGTFRSMLQEGDYRVSWSGLPVGYEIKSIISGSVDLLSNWLKVAVDTPPSPIRVLLSVNGNPWVKVSGRVTNLGSIRTLTLNGPNMDSIQLPVNPDGTFEIAQALPGTYQINETSRLTPSLGSHSISVVIPNQDTTNLIIPLPLAKDVGGIVVNASGAGVQGRLSLFYSQRSANGSSSGSRSISTSPDGKFTIRLSEGDLQFSVSVPDYTVKSLTYGATDLTRENMRVTAADTAELKVVLDTNLTTITTGGVVGVVIGGNLTSPFAGAPPPLPPPPPPPLPPPQPSALSTALNRVSAAEAQANLVTSVPPAYPALATAARVQGTVLLQVEISIQGFVQNVTVMSGHPLLNDAAVQAVRQWTYKPFLVNAQTVPVITTVTVSFTLP
jgi:TonB family protein